MNKSKVNPRVDFIFKKIFGVDENKDLLMDLINSIVEDKDKVSEIHILNPYNENSFAGDKESILDIKGKDALTGKWYNIEMQVSKQGYYDKRALYYWAKVYSNQIREGFDYDILTKSIGINFLNFNTIAEEENYHNVYRMYNTQSGKEFIDDIEIHFIELNKYNGHHTIKSLLDKWIQFLKDAGENYDLPEELQEVKTIKKAMNILENIQMNSSEREAYEARMKYLRDEVGAVKTAKKEGIEEGIKKVAKNMLIKGIDIDTISEITALSKDEIENLKENR
ncbi:MAG: Rpn family recombination-promoting nuclease/putative transposase [Cetobacterium sp.]